MNSLGQETLAEIIENYERRSATILIEGDPSTAELIERRAAVVRELASAKHTPGNPILVAELRGWVAGWITLQRHDPRPQLADIAEVSVFVRREFRKFGVGRQLMQAIQREAARLGWRKLIGFVLAENTDSLRLCRACGWREVGRLEQHIRRGSGWRDAIIVEYLVSPTPAL